MSKHSNGPWTCFPKFDTPNLYAVYDKDENFLENGEIKCATQTANACLIAAAPDLLEVAEIIFNNGVATNIDPCGVFAKKLRAAINKAKGV